MFENTYDYPLLPTHLCSGSSMWNYKLLYKTMVGGACLMTTEHYRRANGYSNFYWGWGQEDDDMYNRLIKTFPKVDRLPERIGRYKALTHPRVKGLDKTLVFKAGSKHLSDTKDGRFDMMKDGVSDLSYNILDSHHVKGYRHVLVEFNFNFMPSALTERRE